MCSFRYIDYKNGDTSILLDGKISVVSILVHEYWGKATRAI